MSAELSLPATWTLGQKRFRLDPDVGRYLVNHSSGFSEAAARLFDETQALGDPAVMMVAKEQYTLFKFLASLLDCRRVVDVGTFTGFTALAFAEGMRPGGRVITIERNPGWVELARIHWQRAGMSDRIEAVIGEAADVLERLASAGEPPYDIVFLDVDKARVSRYAELALALVATRGLVIVDDALRLGRVLDGDHVDPDTVGMRQFNDWIVRDPRFDVVMLPIGDGLTVIRERA